jgi:hypothetical protein
MPSAPSTGTARRRWWQAPPAPNTRHVAFDAAGAERLRALLHRSPRDFGHPTSVWTLELAADLAFAEGLTGRRVSDETVRATLDRLGIR